MDAVTQTEFGAAETSDIDGDGDIAVDGGSVDVNGLLGAEAGIVALLCPPKAASVNATTVCRDKTNGVRSY